MGMFAKGPQPIPLLMLEQVLGAIQVELSAQKSSSIFIVWPQLEVPLPDSIAKEVQQARDLIDEMSGRLIDSSIPNDEFREVIAENAGSYIRRSYRLFEDTGYKPSANVRSNARDYIANVILNNKEDISIEQAFQEADGVISNILRETEGEESVFGKERGLKRL